MSDYGSRGYGSGPEEQGWGDNGRSRGFGDSYDDYDRAGRQRGDGYGDGYGDRGYQGGYTDRGGDGYGDRGADGYGGGYGSGGGTDGYSVRNASPHDEPPTSGRARVPGGDSTGPGRARGSARVGGKRAGGLSEEEAESLKKAKKKKKRRRRLIALGCVMVMFLGIGTVVGTLFFENVPLPKDIIDKELDRNTTITYAGGKKEMGRIGTEQGNRTLVRIPETKKEKAEKKDSDVPRDVKLTLLAMEDRNFYEHDGIDFWGVMRAMVNNITGGSRQGASTLTQQYVGTVSEIRGDGTGYYTKAREAVMAMKMDDEYTKDQIIEHYLNLVYMGRGSYGLGAAAKAWFGKDTKVKDLTASQAAVIFAQVKAPDGSFDPVKAGSDKKLEQRWKYALKGMVDQGWMEKSEQKKFLEEGLPKTEKIRGLTSSAGATDPTGFVSHGQVIAEAEKNYGLDEQDIRSNGYTIETTINPELQKIAQEVARYKKGTAMEGKDKNLRAALVAVNPKNGEVVAYYGGSQDGTHSDKAAAVHPQGSAFKEVTIAAALREGWGPESRWDGSSPRPFKERANGELRNSGEGNGADKPNITLRDATVQSLNTPMYAISVEVGANTIVKLARDMGVRKMEVPDFEAKDEDAAPKVFNLNSKKVQEALESSNPRKFADNEVSFGQFPVSVVDMAAVNGTLANKGIYKETHFIKKITDADGNEVAKTRDLTGKQAVTEAVANDATDILTGVKPNYLGSNHLPTNNQQFAAKSGTWERFCDNDCNESASISFTGYVPELAAAAWVGDKDKENGSVKENGQAAYGAGISGTVWGKFMEEAVKVKGFDTKGSFTKGPGGVGAKDSEVGNKDDDDDDDEGGGGGDGGDDNSQSPDCSVEPDHPDCAGQTPDCTVEPTHPDCVGQSPDCNAFPRPPECDEGRDEDFVTGYRLTADQRAPQSQYAYREAYRHG